MALLEVLPENEVMIVTRGGMIIRSPVSQVRVADRATQGVKLVNLVAGDAVTAVARVIPDDKESGENGDVPVGEAPLQGEQPDLPLEERYERVRRVRRRRIAVRLHRRRFTTAGTPPGLSRACYAGTP